MKQIICNAHVCVADVMYNMESMDGFYAEK